MYDKLAANVDSIDTTGFVLKTKYDTIKADLKKEISDVEKKIPNTSVLIKKTDYISKITGIEDKAPSNSGLVTKTDYNTKISDIKKKITDHDHDNKYITSSEFNKLTTETFKARLTQANLVTKADFYDKPKDISKRIISNKSKHLLVENEMKKLKAILKVKPIL